jgi:hypothetical protein
MTTIPDFLIEMSKRMNTDENRCTAHPFWQVRNKKYVVTEEGYDEHHWEVIHDGACLFRSENSEGYEDLANHLFENNKDWCESIVFWDTDVCGITEQSFIEYFCDEFDKDFTDLPDEYSVIHFQEIEEVLTTHFTKMGAEDFIARKKHDYPNAYTYVESAYWSPELRELQDWIKSLTEQD